MSYNIDNWETITCDLRFTSEVIYDNTIAGIQNDDVAIDLRSKSINIDLHAEDSYMEGQLQNVTVERADDGDQVIGFEAHITDIQLWGSSSGTSYREILIPLLKRSTGSLRAFIVWEGGDSMEVLNVKNGEVEAKVVTSRSIVDLYFPDR